MGRVVAAADIGSNTAHLLIATVTSAGLKRVVNESDWLSLGEAVAREGKISADRREQLIDVFRKFRKLVDAYGVEQSYVFATEAVRRAENHKEVLSEIKKKTGFVVDVVSPRREAELSSFAIRLDTPTTGTTLLLEVGGGSVQLGTCVNGTLTEETGLPLGTGTLTARAGLAQPAGQDAVQRAKELIEAECRAIKPRPHDRIVSCGGVARGLWRALHPDGEPVLRRPELDYLVWSTAQLDPKAIAARFGVKLKRASTLLPGALVLTHLMDRYGTDELIVSEYGVREGAILEMVSEGDAWLKK